MEKSYPALLEPASAWGAGTAGTARTPEQQSQLPSAGFPLGTDFPLCFTHTTSFQQAGGYFPPRSKWASQRSNDKSNWRTVSVAELCKMKDLQTLRRVWSNTCSVSRQGRARVTALSTSVFDPWNTGALGEATVVHVDAAHGGAGW